MIAALWGTFALAPDRMVDIFNYTLEAGIPYNCGLKDYGIH